MKKFLMTFLVALTIAVTISSCDPKEEDPTCTMCATYNGKINGDIKVVEQDTTLVDVTSIAKIEETSYEDSVSLTVDVEIAGTPVSVNVMAFKNSESTFSVTNTIYKYGGAVPILVNGSGTANGTTCTANITLAEADGTTDSIDGDINFAGTK